MDWVWFWEQLAITMGIEAGDTSNMPFRDEASDIVIEFLASMGHGPDDEEIEPIQSAMVAGFMLGALHYNSER